MHSPNHQLNGCYMRISIRLMMAALVAALALSIAASSAMALRSISIDGPTTLTLTGRVTFTGGSIRIRCDTTFVKTISRVIPKTEGILIGQVTDVRIARPELCTAEGATFRGATILPATEPELWRIFFKSFLGTLPDITGLLFELHNTKVRLDVAIIGISASCLFINRRAGTIAVLAAVNAGVIGRLKTLDERAEAVETELIRSEGPGGGGCPRTGRFNAAVEPVAGQNTRIRLI